MRTSTMKAGYVPAASDRRNSFAAIKDNVNERVNNFFRMIDCPLDTESDRHYAKSLAAVFLSLLFPPLLALAVFQLIKAQEKRGGKTERASLAKKKKDEYRS